MVGFCNFFKIVIIDGFRQRIHRAFRIYKIVIKFYRQNQFIEKCFIFTMYQNYTLALISLIVSGHTMSCKIH